MTDAGCNVRDSDDSVTEIAALCLKEQFAELFRYWKGAAERGEESIEDVHQLRVSSRRAAAALGLFHDWLPKRKTKRLIRIIGAVRQSAGPVRDCDVFMNRIANREGHPNDHRLEQLVHELQNRRMKSLQTLNTFYKACEEGDRIESLAANVICLLRPHDPQEKDERTPFNQWAVRKLRKAARSFYKKSDVDIEHLGKLHKFRISVKELRYRLEILSPVLNATHYQKAASGLKKLSQKLGEINDHATAIESLSRWIDSEFEAESIRVLKQWRSAERRVLQKALDDFSHWWTPSRRRKLRQKLKHAARPLATVTAAA